VEVNEYPLYLINLEEFANRMQEDWLAAKAADAPKAELLELEHRSEAVAAKFNVELTNWQDKRDAEASSNEF